MRHRRTRGNRLIRRLVGGAKWSVIALCGFAASTALAQGILPNTRYPVGMTQVEYIDSANSGRPLNYMLIYPAAPQASATLFKIFLSTNLHLYKDAPIAAGGLIDRCALRGFCIGGTGDW